MSAATDNLSNAQKRAMLNRPKVGGFPYLAEVLRQAGVTTNIWNLPSCQSIYLTKLGPVVNQMPALINGTADIPAFDEKALVTALRLNQAGESTFPEFLQSSWDAGVVRYEVNFGARHVVYYGVNGESYQEEYPEVVVK